MRLTIVLLFLAFGLNAFAQDTFRITLRSQYYNPLKEKQVNINGVDLITDDSGHVFINPAASPNLTITSAGYKEKTIAVNAIKPNRKITLTKDFDWKDLLNPQYYIVNGGLWMILFIVFAETGLFAGFFLPGDALLFVTGIYSSDIVGAALFNSNSQWIDLFILWVLISIAGILGNYVGYWFGKKSGTYLFHKKDTFLFKKKYLIQAHDFYEKNGGSAIVAARFVPLVRTFAPIVAGIVLMDKHKFTYYNVLGSVLWVGSMLFGGHFLQTWILHQFHFDLKSHLEVIVIGIVAVTTIPVLYKIFFSRKKPQPKP
jgi:membrane-associated protein